MRPSQALPDLQIGSSYWQMLGIFGASFGVATACALMALNLLPGIELNASVVFAGRVGLVLFGLGTCKVALSLLQANKPVLFVSLQGIRDARTSKEIIPWNSIEAVSVSQLRFLNYVILKLRPNSAPAEARAMAGLGKSYGVDGVTISPIGLTVKTAELFDICLKYRAASLSLTDHSASL